MVTGNPAKPTIALTTISQAATDSLSASGPLSTVMVGNSSSSILAARTSDIMTVDGLNSVICFRIASMEEPAASTSILNLS